LTNYVCVYVILTEFVLPTHACSQYIFIISSYPTYSLHPSICPSVPYPYHLLNVRTPLCQCAVFTGSIPRLHCQPSCSNRLAVLACVHIIREDSSAIAGRHSRPTHLLLLHLHEQEEYKLVRVLNCQLVDVGRYLTVKITEGETHHITCPGFGCSMLVPVEIIEKLVSREMARRYLQFDIKVNL